MAADRVSKAEWMAQRLAGERARGQGQHAAGVNRLPRYDAATMNPFGSHGKLAEAINKPIGETVKAKSRQIDRELAHAAPKGSTIEATTPSTCLASLSWQADEDGDGNDGTVTYEFYRGGSLVYEDDCTLDEFLEWAESDSLGQTGNAEWFD